jgi:SAM-dependent methyltransferase
VPDAPTTSGDLDTIDDGIVEVFEAPSRWRAHAIRRMGLQGDELVEAASPSPAFPQLLWFVERAVNAAPEGPVVDLGAGLGGLAHALASRTGRDAVAVEASAACCLEARALFPGLVAARATASAVPLAQAAAAAVVMCGVASLLDDVDGPFGEARRVLRDDGSFVLVDLVAAGGEDVRTGPNRFRSMETLEQALVRTGFEVVDRAVGSVESGLWGEVADAVNRELIARHRGDDGYDRWLEDHRHLAQVLASGRVLMAGLSAISRRPTPARRA